MARSTWKLLSCVSLLFVISIPETLAQNVRPAPELVQNPPIVYTGRLLGYFRWPDQQVASHARRDSCQLTNAPNDPTENPNDNAREFLNAPRLKTPFDKRILVGTGDNLAPELFSRTINDPLAKPGEPRGLKDNYVWDETHYWRRIKNVPANDPLNSVFADGRGSIPMDNVGCFAARAGYDALVPGEYDFYFGPERLRQIARFLVNVPEKGDFHKVRMLGANLAIETAVEHAAPRIPHWEKHRNYSDDPGDLDLSISDGAKVMPWLREISAGGLKATNEVYVCRQESQGDPEKFTVPSGDNKPSSCELLKPKAPADNEGKVIFAIPDDPAHKLKDGRIPTFLQPNTNYHLCVTGVHNSSKKESTYCAAFTVATPLFTHPDTILAPGQEGTSPYPEPYVVKKVTLDGGQTRDVAIFGVVDPVLNQHIGQLNDAWMNTISGRSTAVKVLDPVVALRQLLQYFKEDKKGFDGLKILLAHMPHYQAARLAEKFKDEFQVVITQSELDYATEEQTVEFKILPSPTATNRYWPGSPVLVVPKPVYNGNPPKGAHRLQLQLHELLLSQKSSCKGSTSPNCKEVWTYSDTKDDPRSLETAVETRLLEAGNEFDAALDTTLAAQPFHPHGSDMKPLDKLQHLTLSALRKRGHADVILLQKRDWFDTYLEKLPGPGELQDVLDRVFFKGDFLTKTVVTGRVLKQVMDESSVFDKDDKDNVALFHVRNQGLKPLGIFKDSVAGEYIVNGDAVQDDQLYSIVASDFIASGDTGYPAMAKPVVGDPVRASRNLKLTYISSAVCEEFVKYSGKYSGEQCRNGQVYGGEYFDVSNLPPTDETKGVTATHHFLSWVNPRNRPSVYKDAGELETEIQNRNFFRLSIEKASLGYNYQNHNRHSEQELTRLFSGVSQPGIADVKQTKTLTTDWRIRATRGYLFGLNEAEYESKYVRGTDPTISKNSLAFEGGLTPQLFPQLKENGRLLGLLSVRWKTELATPIRTFTVDSGNIRQPIQRDKDVLGKAGLRFENVKSWIEAGYQFGEKLSTPGGFTFNANLPNAIVCRLGAVGKDSNGKDLTVQGCVDQNRSTIDVQSGFVVIPINKFEHGAFLDFLVNMPLPFKNDLTYTMENRGDIFFNRGSGIDLPIDTRFLDKWSHSLAIPLVGNLSLVPKFEYTYFRNKVNKNSFSNWQQTITFQYSLDWRPGIPFGAALRYRNPKR